jgi:hypothetical protein
MKRMQSLIAVASQPTIPRDEDKLLSITLLSRRCGCSTQIAKQRIKKFGLPVTCFSKTPNAPKGVMLSAVLRLEEVLSRPLTEQEE